MLPSGMILELHQIKLCHYFGNPLIIFSHHHSVVLPLKCEDLMLFFDIYDSELNNK